MLRILYDDFDQKVKNIHDEIDLHHSYKKKRVKEHKGRGKWLSYYYNTIYSTSADILTIKL